MHTYTYTYTYMYIYVCMYVIMLVNLFSWLNNSYLTVTNNNNDDDNNNNNNLPKAVSTRVGKEVERPCFKKCPNTVCVTYSL